MTIFAVFALVSSGLFILADVKYIREIFYGSVKPQRVTWGIVSLLNGIAVANQMASGGKDSVTVFIVLTALTGFIFLLSLKYGVGGTSRFDMAILTIALLGIVLWQVFDVPLYSILASAIVATAAMIPSILKAYDKPETEDLFMWTASTIAVIFMVLSVGSFSFDLLILPILGTILNGSMLISLLMSPQRI